jgi:hypothetical protein
MTRRDVIKLSVCYGFGAFVSSGAWIFYSTLTTRNALDHSSTLGLALSPIAPAMMGAYFAIPYGVWLAIRSRRLDLVVMQGFWIPILAGVIAFPSTLGALSWLITRSTDVQPLSEGGSFFIFLAAIAACTVVFVEISFSLLRLLPRNVVIRQSPNRAH